MIGLQATADAAHAMESKPAEGRLARSALHGDGGVALVLDVGRLAALGSHEPPARPLLR